MNSHLLPLRKESITLAQAVKAAGLADTGGQGKFLVRTGGVLVNGVVETRPGRKLFPGDRFAVGDDEWLMGRAGEPGQASASEPPAPRDE